MSTAACRTFSRKNTRTCEGCCLFGVVDFFRYFRECCKPEQRSNVGSSRFQVRLDGWQHLAWDNDSSNSTTDDDDESESDDEEEESDEEEEE